MRRPDGPCGGVARRYVLTAADVDATSKKKDDFAARAAYRRAEKKGDKKKAEVGGQKKGIVKVQGGRPDPVWLQ